MANAKPDPSIRLADLLTTTAQKVQQLREQGAVDALEPDHLDAIVDGLTVLTEAMSALLDGAKITPAGGSAGGWTSPDLAAIRQAFAIANRDARSYQAKLAREEAKPTP